MAQLYSHTAKPVKRNKFHTMSSDFVTLNLSQNICRFLCQNYIKIMQNSKKFAVCSRFLVFQMGLCSFKKNKQYHISVQKNESRIELVVGTCTGTCRCDLCIRSVCRKSIRVCSPYSCIDIFC